MRVQRVVNVTNILSVESGPYLMRINYHDSREYAVIVRHKERGTTRSKMFSAQAEPVFGMDVADYQEALAIAEAMAEDMDNEIKAEETEPEAIENKTEEG